MEGGGECGVQSEKQINIYFFFYTTTVVTRFFGKYEKTNETQRQPMITTYRKRRKYRSHAKINYLSTAHKRRNRNTGSNDDIM